MANFVQIAFNLACSAKLVAEMTPIVMQMVKEFSQMSPRLLNGAFSFFKFTKSLEPFLNERMDNLKSLSALEEENWRLRDVDEKNHMLKNQFGTSTLKLDWAQKREEQQKDIMVYQLTECRVWKNKLRNWRRK